MNDARNFIAIVTGRKGSGKSALLAQYARRFPRRLVLDMTGEHSRDVPAALVTYELSATIRLLRKLAGRERWTMVAQLQPDAVPALLAWLMPVGRDSSPALVMGGLVIECGELNEIAPNHQGIATEVRRLFTAGRHHRVSTLGAARTATELNHITTSQADYICAFRQHEIADVKRIAALMGTRALPALHGLQLYEYLRYRVDTHQLWKVDAQGRAQLIPESAVSF